MTHHKTTKHKSAQQQSARRRSLRFDASSSKMTHFVARAFTLILRFTSPVLLLERSSEAPTEVVDILAELARHPRHEAPEPGAVQGCATVAPAAILTEVPRYGEPGRRGAWPVMMTARCAHQRLVLLRGDGVALARICREKKLFRLICSFICCF